MVAKFVAFVAFVAFVISWCRFYANGFAAAITNSESQDYPEWSRVNPDIPPVMVFAALQSGSSAGSDETLISCWRQKFYATVGYDI